MRKFIVLFVITIIGSCANAALFNFNAKGYNNSNEILKNYIEDELQETGFDVVSYFCDIDNDNKNEVVGIVKHGQYYRMTGYKLIILKSDEEGNWSSINTNVYFDPASKLEIEDNTITYFENHLGKEKKQTAKIKTDKVVSKKGISGFYTDKKISRLEHNLEFDAPKVQNKLEIEDFNAQGQRNVNITYKNLSEKTKHYLDIK